MPHEGTLIRLHLGEVLDLGLNFLPALGRIGYQASVPRGDDQRIRIMVLQDFAEFVGNPQTPFGVKAVDRLPPEVRLFQYSHLLPLIPTFSHFSATKFYFFSFVKYNRTIHEKMVHPDAPGTEQAVKTCPSYFICHELWRCVMGVNG